MFKIYDESESPNEWACLRYMMNRNRQSGGVLLKIYGESDMMNRKRQMRRRVQDI